MLKERKLIKEGKCDYYADIPGSEIIEDVAWDFMPDSITEYENRHKYLMQIIKKWAANDPIIQKIYDTDYTIWAEGWYEEATMWDDGGSGFDITSDDGLEDDISQIKNDKLRELIDKEANYKIERLDFSNYTEEREDYYNAEEASRRFKGEW